MILIGTFVSLIIALVSSVVSLLMACEGLVWLILILIIILAVIEFIKKLNKPKGAPGQEEIKNTESNIYYRYRLYNISTKQILAMTNNYMEAFNLKQKLGPSVMIKDDWGFKHDRKNVSNCRKLF